MTKIEEIASLLYGLKNFGAQGKLSLCSAATDSKAEARRIWEGTIYVVEQLCKCVACTSGTSWPCKSLRASVFPEW